MPAKSTVRSNANQVAMPAKRLFATLRKGMIAGRVLALLQSGDAVSNTQKLQRTGGYSVHVLSYRSNHPIS
jgi:hypothetical protein